MYLSIEYIPAIYCPSVINVYLSLIYVHPKQYVFVCVQPKNKFCLAGSIQTLAIMFVNMKCVVSIL